MRNLRLHLASVLGSVLGASTVMACSGKVAEKQLRDPLTESLCSNERVSLVKGLSPSETVDYVALRSSSGSGSSPIVIQEEGACGSATACEGLQAGVDGTGVFVSSWTGETEHLAVTRGEDVKLLMTIDEVKAFLGSIDTPSEAALLARFDGFDLDCDGKNLEPEDDAYLIYAEQGQTCGDDIRGYQLEISAEGEIVVRDTKIVEKGDKNCQIGRLPPGLCQDAEVGSASAANGRGATAVGEYFAEVAYLEAAAVAAFRRLADELEVHQAPVALVEKAREAAREETRHAVLMRALARRYGSESPVPVVKVESTRSLYDLAIDNAVEGLTRETFGALIAQHQSRVAVDPQVRQVMRLIAQDETGHAEFSWELHDWLRSRLTSVQNEEVKLARAHAIVRFRGVMEHAFSSVVRTQAGLPTVETSRSLYNALFNEDLALT